MSEISVRHVTMTYDGLTALDDISFEVESGDYLCIVGENGTGKSTLLKGLAGILQPKKGEIVYGQEVSRKQMGYLPQQAGIQKDFPASVGEVVLSGCLPGLGRRPFFGKKEKNVADQNMQRLGILDLKKKSYRELSGGQQQRVLLARALCSAKQILFLDEPVTGLDPLVTEEMYRIIEQLNQEEKITVVMVSHDVQTAVQYANKILHLNRRVLFFGKTEQYRCSDVGRLFLMKR